MVLLVVLHSLYTNKTYTIINAVRLRGDHTVYYILAFGWVLIVSLVIAAWWSGHRHPEVDTGSDR